MFNSMHKYLKILTKKFHSSLISTIYVKERKAFQSLDMLNI
jgi:hypothetical protein